MVYELARGLAQKGHSVLLWHIVSDGSYPPVPHLELKQVSIHRSRFFPAYEWNALRRLRYIRKASVSVDIWVISTIPFYPYASILKPSVVLDFGLPPTYGFTPLQKFNFTYMGWTQYGIHYRKSQKVFTISYFLQEKLSEALRQKSTVLYPGSDHYARGVISPRSHEKPPDIRNHLKIPSDHVLFLYVGRLNPSEQPYKGVKDLVEMTRHLKTLTSAPFSLLLVGYGGEEERKRWEREGIPVLTNVPHSWLPAIYDTTDVVVSASRWEGFNLPLLEGQSFGRPVIAYKVGGHPEVVKEEVTGFLARTQKEFINYMKLLTENRDIRYKMGEEAFHWSQKFQWRYSVEKLHLALSTSGSR